jgi:DNA polymerase-1
MKPLLADASVLKIGHNIKYDMLVLRKYGIDITPIEDTMLLSYVLNAGNGNHNMDDLAQKHLNHNTIKYDEVTGTGKARISFAEVALDKALAYAAEDADVTLRLWQAIKPQVVAKRLLTLYEIIERPLVPVLVAMEERGIKVDKSALAALSADFGYRIAALEQEIYKLVGHPFNIGSPKQLGEVLFDELQLPGGKKGKTGSYSTSADVLDELAEAGHPLPMRVLDWRQLSKLKSTYTDSLAEEINAVTGRVHTSYAMAVASTGRLSSTDPNLQNIPIRTEEGRKIRNAFVAAEGNKLISADYSQIELRLLAHIAEIDVLKEAFRNGQDIHAITASQMFGVPVESVASDLRRKAKTINFGIIYGISAHGLAVRLGISRGEAATYIDAYFKQYPGIVEYMERTRKYAREHGHVVTLFGRVCHLPGIHDKNGAMRSFSERAAINAPLQGTAADIIKRAMIGVEQAFWGTSSRMLLQVHDELVVETPAAEAEAVSAKVKHIMENAAHLSVPLTVETFTGSNWNEAH